MKKTSSSSVQTESGDLYIWRHQIQFWLRLDYRVVVAGPFSERTHMAPATTTNGGYLVPPEEWAE